MRTLLLSSETPRHFDVQSAEGLDEVLAIASASTSDLGTPAVELKARGGASLVIAQTGVGMVLSWADSLGGTFHSVGQANGRESGTMVFDYCGEYTEVPARHVVPYELGRAAARAFVRGEDPTIVGVIFEPD